MIRWVHAVAPSLRPHPAMACFARLHATGLQEEPPDVLPQCLSGDEHQDFPEGRFSTTKLVQ